MTLFLEQSQDLPPTEQHQESESGSLQSTTTPAPSFGSVFSQQSDLYQVEIIAEREQLPEKYPDRIVGKQMTSTSHLCSFREQIHCHRPNTAYRTCKWLAVHNKNCPQFHLRGMADQRITWCRLENSKARSPSEGAGWPASIDLWFGSESKACRVIWVTLIPYPATKSKHSNCSREYLDFLHRREVWEGVFHCRTVLQLWRARCRINLGAC